ncbi:MFS transporter [Streptomyces sp. NPDC052101]|uniref:MFS transporter n=1 Tax=Streptomyces sp. NPDC052101 TaxID=3155763 RepID=UPI00343897E1
MKFGTDFTRLWTAGAVSMLGDGMFVAAMPLLAASLSSDPRKVALVATFAGLPWLFLSLPAGALADRLDRRRLILAAQSVQLLIVPVLALLAATHMATIWMLCALAFSLSSAETVFRAASEAVLPAVVAKEHLVAANSRQQASTFITEESLGPPAGAALFAVSASLPFWVDALTFLASLALIARIRPRAQFRPRAIRPSMRADLLTGLRWLRGNQLIRTLVGLAALANFTTFMALSTMVLFAQQKLHLDKAGYGLLVSGMAIGGVVGSLLSRRVVSTLGLRTTVRLLPLLAPLVFLTVGLLARNTILVGALLAVSGFALSLWNVVSFTLRQVCVPTELLGRVGGAAKTISFGVGPLGSLTGGLVAHQWGLAAPWVVAGGVRLVLVLVAVPTLGTATDAVLTPGVQELGASAPSAPTR